jgi:hypothetical protein
VGFHAYIDVSCTGARERVFAVAGYLIEDTKALAMDSLWRSSLAEFKLPYFRMVDCAHGNGVFSSFSPAERSEIARRFIELTKGHITVGVACLANPLTFDDRVMKTDIYGFCLQFCVMPMIMCALKFNEASSKAKTPIAFYFQAGHRNHAKAHAYLLDNLENEKTYPGYHRDHSYAAKTAIPLLQCADILAWQATKRVKCAVFEKRAPRKDFESLLEAGHKFVYAHTNQHGPLIGLDEFPQRFDAQSVAKLHALFGADDKAQQYMQQMYDQVKWPVGHPLRREKTSSEYIPHYATTDQQGLCANILRKEYGMEIALLKGLEDLGEELKIFPRHINNVIRFAKERHAIRADICFVLSVGAVGRSKGLSPVAACALKLEPNSYCIVFDLQLLIQIVLLTARFCTSRTWADYFNWVAGKPDVISEPGLLAASLTPVNRALTEDEAQYQTLLWGSIIGFVTAHEIAHIKNGHLDFLGSMGSVEAIQEFETAQHDADYFLTRQTLEMDADCIGFNIISAYLPYTLHDSIVPAKSPHQNIEFLYFVLLLGAEISSLIFSSGSIEKPQALSAHPKPLQRLGFIFNMLQNLHWHKEREDQLPHLEFLCKQSITLVVQALRETCPNVSIGPATLGHEDDDNDAAYGATLLRRWGEIRPRLLPFVLGGSLAPAQEV